MRTAEWTCSRRRNHRPPQRRQTKPNLVIPSIGGDGHGGYWRGGADGGGGEHAGGAGASARR